MLFCEVETVKILLYLLEVVCASGQSALGKRFAKQGGDVNVFNMNKALSGLIAFLVIGLIRGMSLHLPSLLFGGCYGLFLCVSMYTGFQALKSGPMALTSVIASFSLIVPFLFGIVMWEEELSLFGIFGMILLVCAIVLLNLKKESGFSAKWSIYAFSTLLANGFCSVTQKYHQLAYPGKYRNEFMIAAMLIVFLGASIGFLARKQEKKWSFCADGLLAGCLNGAASDIVLYLSASEKAVVLFPVIAAANMIAVWLIGRFAFAEKLKGIQVAGLTVGILSVVLLNVA